MSRRGVSGWMFLLVPAHPGRPGQRAVKRSCVCVTVCVCDCVLFVCPCCTRKTARVVDTKLSIPIVCGRISPCTDPEVNRSGSKLNFSSPFLFSFSSQYGVKST